MFIFIRNIVLVSFFSLTIGSLKAQFESVKRFRTQKPLTAFKQFDPLKKFNSFKEASHFKNVSHLSKFDSFKKYELFKQLDSLKQLIPINELDTLIEIRKRLYNPYFSFDGRNSFVFDKPVGLFGIQVGITIKQNRFGLGYYSLNREVLIEKIVVENNNIDRYFKFNYVNFFYERTLFKNFRWEIYTPFGLGIGNGIIRNLDNNKNQIAITRDLNGMISIGAIVEYKIRPWIGVNVGGGYRNMINSYDLVGEAFDAPYYSYGLIFYFDYWFTRLFDKEEAKQMNTDFMKEKEDIKEKRKEKNEDGNGLKNLFE